HTDGVPTISIPDTNNPGSGDGDKTVAETDGPIAGDLTVKAEAGINTVTIGGTDVSLAQLNNLGTTPVTITTPKGVLVLTGYDSATGKLSYTYDPSIQSSNSNVLDPIAVIVKDNNGQSSTDSLDITITDSKPFANDDSASVTEDTTLTATGNVYTSNDVIGGDGAPTAGAVSPVTINLTYGSLVLTADGNYTYTLNNNNSAVNALNDGQSLTDTYKYTITDKDGSTATADLKITING
ncbi:VCBS domain-containing protein, partial [Leeia sp. TBRC 13508]